MIVLITGASHTGKTVAAQRLLEKHGWPYLSLDLLKMGLIRSGQTKLTPMDDKELIPYIWGIAKEMIKTAIENGQHLIVEGCYIPFDWQDGFTEEYLREIRWRCLVMSERYIEEHFDDILAHEDEVEKRLYHDFEKEEALRWNRFYREGCEKHGLEYVLIDKEYCAEIDV